MLQDKAIEEKVKVAELRVHFKGEMLKMGQRKKLAKAGYNYIKSRCRQTWNMQYVIWGNFYKNLKNNTSLIKRELGIQLSKNYWQRLNQTMTLKNQLAVHHT